VSGCYGATRDTEKQVVGILQALSFARSSMKGEMHMNSRIHKHGTGAFLTVTALSLMAGYPQSSYAQEAVGEEVLEEITVTGSHIKRDTFNYSTPVTVMSEVEISGTGTTNLGDLMQTLPQTISTFNNANTAFFTTFSGLNLTDLRFLGTDRTLVLVNGRRFVSGAPPGGGYGVDLNSIPTGIIERVEVLTGGASAIYGSDAVAGVVNVITKTDFEGIEVDLQVGAATEGDKNKEDITITMGGEFGEGGFGVMSVGYSNDDPLRSRDRELSAFDLVYEDLNGDGFGETAVWLGSSFPPQGRLNPPNTVTTDQYNGDGTVFRDPSNADGSFGTPDVSDRFNRAAFRTIFNPVKRRFAAANASYPLTDRITAFTEINWSTVATDSEIEPFALSINDDIFQFSRGGNTGLDVASNLLMPQLLKDNLIAAGVTNTNQLGTSGWVRRLLEFGPRASQVDRTTTRGLTGLSVAISDDWDLEAYVSYGRTEQNQENTGQINTERAAEALNVELAADGVTIQCVSELARIQGCVPFNVFGAGTITPEAFRYLHAPGNLKTIVEQQIFHLGVTGELGWELPGGRVAVAGGFEYRDENGAEINPGFNQTGIGGGNATAPTNGGFDVSEVYGEVILPVMDILSLDAAVRYGDYSTVGGQSTWKVGFDLSAIESFRIRGTVSQSVRAPNIADLFAGAGETFANVNDPCDGVDNTTTGQIADNCRSIQVIQDRINAQGSFSLTQPEQQGTGGFIGGNPLVNEETADSYTFGIVWQPDFLEAFSLAVDYYNIKIDDGIATTSRNTVLRRCYDVPTAEFDPTCGIGFQPGGRARRDMRPGAGALVGVDSGTSNENRFETDGVDIEMAYSMDLGPGTLGLGLVWNQLLSWDEIGIESGDVDDNAGEILTPDSRASGRISYTAGEWDAFWRLRYWSSAKDSNTPELFNENDCFCSEGLAPSANEVSAYVYSDISVGYSKGPYSVRAGLNNAFDKKPPMLPQFTQYGNTGTNTAAEAYDTIGAAWYLSFNYNTN
jgi:outer membrane receptor protein involved in Fe transport